MTERPRVGVPADILEVRLSDELLLSAVELTTANIVVKLAKVDSTGKVDMQKLFPFSTGNPQQFKKVSLRINDSTALFFDSGKMVISGCRHLSDMDVVIERVRSLFLRQMHPIQFTSFVLNMSVGVGYGACSMDLQRIYEDYSVYCTYDYNVFPLLTFRFPNTTIAIQVSYHGACTVLCKNGPRASLKVWAWFFHNFVLNPRYRHENSNSIPSSSLYRILRQDERAVRSAAEVNSWWKTRYTEQPSAVPTKAPEGHEYGDAIAILKLSAFAGHGLDCPLVARWTLPEIAQHHAACASCESSTVMDVLDVHWEAGCYSHDHTDLPEEYAARVVGEINAFSALVEKWTSSGSTRGLLALECGFHD